MHAWLALSLWGCPAFEGPIDVVLVQMESPKAEISWAVSGSEEFAACANGATNPDAAVGCGPYGVGEPGTYVVRVTWNGATLDKEVTLVDDGDYRANTEVTFDVSEFAS
jgi:hypothetical protein